MDELELLGFESPRVLKHKNGIEIYVPDDKNSSDWCIHIPSILVKDEMFKNGLSLYFISYEMVISTVKKYSNKEEQEKYMNYVLAKREEYRTRQTQKVKEKREYITKPKKKHAYYDDVIEYRKQGLSYQEIGDKIGYSKQMIYNIVNK